MKKQTSKTLPPDPEEKNDERANAASQALDRFTFSYGEKPQAGMNAQLLHDLKAQNLSDLLCDLAHYCDRAGLDFEERLTTARYHYQEETGEQGTQLPAPTAYHNPDVVTLPKCPNCGESEITIHVDALANFALLGWDKDGDVIANFDTPLDVDFSEDRKYECSRCGHESNFCDGSEFRPEESATRYNMTDTATTRSARLASLLGNENAPLFENGFEMPSEPCRYLAIEYSSGDAIWAMVADNLGTMARAIEASDTERDSVTVFDLDTGDKLITEFQVTAFLRDNGERILTPASTPRVVIVIDSGCIQDVISDAPVKIWTIDYDTEGADDSDLAEIPQGGGETRQAYPGEYYGTQDAQLTAALITAIKA